MTLLPHLAIYDAMRAADMAGDELARRLVLTHVAPWWVFEVPLMTAYRDGLAWESRAAYLEARQLAREARDMTMVSRMTHEGQGVSTP